MFNIIIFNARAAGRRNIRKISFFDIVIVAIFKVSIYRYMFLPYFALVAVLSNRRDYIICLFHLFTSCLSYNDSWKNDLAEPSRRRY